MKKHKLLQNMSQWTVFLGIAIGVVGLLLTASVSQAEDPVELTFWTEFSAPPQGPTMDKIVEAFNELNPDIVVKHTRFENTPYETAIKAAYAGGDPPDIAEINGGGDTFQYALAGELLDLTDFVNAHSDVIIPGLDVMYNYEGTIYGVPWELNLGNVLWYNPKMLEEQGIDPESIKTWSGFLAACEKFKQAGITPIAFGNKEQWNGNHWFTHILRRLLTTEEYVAINTQSLIPSVTSEIKWSDPKPVKAWEMYKELLDKGYFTAGYLSDDYAAASLLFYNGTAPFFQTGSWFLGGIRDQAPDAPVDFIIFPEIEGAPGKQLDIVNHSLVIAISKRSKHPEEAKRFLEYLMTEQASKMWTEAVKGPVPYVYDSSGWDLDPLLLKLLQRLSEAPSAAPFVDILEDYSCNVEHTWEASVGILTGDLTPQESGEAHEECVRDLRAERGWE